VRQFYTASSLVSDGKHFSPASNIKQAQLRETSSSSDTAPPAADSSLAPARVTLMADCAGGEVQFDPPHGQAYRGEVASNARNAAKEGSVTIHVL